jgi:hypothetical protein
MSGVPFAFLTKFKKASLVIAPPVGGLITGQMRQVAP